MPPGERDISFVCEHSDIRRRSVLEKSIEFVHTMIQSGFEALRHKQIDYNILGLMEQQSKQRVSSPMVLLSKSYLLCPNEVILAMSQS